MCRPYIVKMSPQQQSAGNTFFLVLLRVMLIRTLVIKTTTRTRTCGTKTRTLITLLAMTDKDQTSVSRTRTHYWRMRLTRLQQRAKSLPVCWFTYTVSQKNCTPKSGRHKFVKISSPIMIFHTRHLHSVAD